MSAAYPEFIRLSLHWTEDDAHRAVEALYQFDPDVVIRKRQARWWQRKYEVALKRRIYQ